MGQSRDGPSKITRWAADTAADSPVGSWAIVEIAAATPAGTVSLSHPPASDEVQIGWTLHPDSSGRGYAAEAATAILDHAIATGVHRVWALMWPHNKRSARVAERCGMADVGVVNDPWYGTAEEPRSRMFPLDQLT